MDGTHSTLASLLTLAGLIGGTIEYAEIVRRRIAMRGRAAEQEQLADSGLRALVRVLVATDPKAPR